MQKVEVILEGKDEEICAALINNVVSDIVKSFNVQPVNIYCGRAAVKRGFAELSIPSFMNRKN